MVVVSNIFLWDLVIFVKLTFHSVLLNYLIKLPTPSLTQVSDMGQLYFYLEDMKFTVVEVQAS